MAYRIPSGIKTKHLARGPLVWMARIGYAARGIVFLLIGTFALLAAGGLRERPQGARDALEFAFQLPLGGYFLWTLAVGLVCFAGWRLLQSVFDADRHGSDSYGLMRRAALGGSALFYLGLGAATARVTFEERRVSEDQSAREWTAWLMAQPLGRFLLALIAVGFVSVAIGLALAVVLGAAPAPAQTVTIGVALPQDDNPFYIAMLRAIRARAQELGWAVATVSSNEDKAKQFDLRFQTSSRLCCIAKASTKAVRGEVPAHQARSPGDRDRWLEPRLLDRSLLPRDDGLLAGVFRQRRADLHCAGFASVVESAGESRPSINRLSFASGSPSANSIAGRETAVPASCANETRGRRSRQMPHAFVST